MTYTRAKEIAKKLNQAGVPPVDPEYSRLLLRVMRTLAKGRPITSGQVEEVVSGLDMDRAGVEQFLETATERDSDDNIFGITGLSLNEEWAHRLEVNGVPLRAWCAWDTLFIPLLLDQGAMVESASPLSKEMIRVTVSPDGVKQIDPEGAVVSVVVLDPANGQVGSVEEAWSQFCHQVYFFASREEAQRWAEGKNGIEILTVDEAFELGRYAWSRVLSYA